MPGEPARRRRRCLPVLVGSIDDSCCPSYSGAPNRNSHALVDPGLEPGVSYLRHSGRGQPVRFLEAGVVKNDNAHVHAPHVVSARPRLAFRHARGSSSPAHQPTDWGTAVSGVRDERPRTSSRLHTCAPAPWRPWPPKGSRSSSNSSFETMRATCDPVHGRRGSEPGPPQSRIPETRIRYVRNGDAFRGRLERTRAVEDPASAAQRTLGSYSVPMWPSSSNRRYSASLKPSSSR